jgi:sporulation protein YlmC with PRC-barrel domain
LSVVAHRGNAVPRRIVARHLLDTALETNTMEHDKMKHINRYALTLASAAASAALMCGTVAAQERSDSPAQRSQNQAAQDRNLSAGNVHATHIIGAQVKNNAGQDIGEVQDLIVSSNGNIRTAVITVGGVLGVGAKKIGVPYRDFSASPDGKTLYVNMTEEQLEAYPEFNEDADDVHAANRSADPTPRSTAPAAGAATGAAVQREHDTREAERNAAAREAESNRQARERSNADATGSVNTPATPGARNGNADASDKPARTLRASEQAASALIGADVVDSSDSKVGEIKDLIVSAGRQVMAVLTIGRAALGTGGHMVAVPLDDLTIQRDESDPKNEPDRVQTKLTVAQLEAMPEFKYE